MALVAQPFDIVLIALDPARDREIRKTCPCVVIPPDEMKRHIGIVIVAPMATQGQDYPTRVAVTFRRKNGQIVLDQIRTMDKARLVKHLGRLDRSTATRVLSLLRKMFAA